MKYIVYTMFIVVLFLSFCNNLENEDLKMEILNTEIISRGNISDKTARNALRFDNYIYDSIPVNKINVKITNTGNKKYVLFIKKEIDDVENFRDENMQLTIFDEDKIIQPVNFGGAINSNGKSFESRKFKNEIESDSLKKELNEIYLKEKINKNKIRFQREMSYVVIHPGETKFFSYYKTLPIFIEHVESYYIYKFDVIKKYFCQLSFKNEAAKLKKNLTTNQLKEIEENEYTIFDGLIKSNKVPIRFTPSPQ